MCLWAASQWNMRIGPVNKDLPDSWSGKGQVSEVFFGCPEAVIICEARAFCWCLLRRGTAQG